MFNHDLPKDLPSRCALARYLDSASETASFVFRGRGLEIPEE